ncbi:SIS domain-containing protein [Halosimplex aquaticum]
MVVALSQSGETTETVAALERAGRRGAETAAITNTAGSTLDERAERTYVTPAGREEAVMATKTVGAAVAALYLLADRFRDGGPDLSAVGERCREALTVDLSGAVSAITATDRLYALGTGPFHGVAGEAATKFAEATRHHATPLSTLEITHGPIANSDGSAVLVFALTGDRAVYRHVLERLTDAGAETVVFRPADESYAATETIAVGRPVETALPALKLRPAAGLRGRRRTGPGPGRSPGAIQARRSSGDRRAEPHMSGTIDVYAGTVLTPGETYSGAVISVVDGRIDGINESPERSADLSFPDGIAIPGLIDVHTHGFGGHCATSGHASDVAEIAESAPSHGVTTVFPTTMSATHGRLLDAASAFAAARARAAGGADLPGLHLEGPYFTDDGHSGVQDPDTFREPSVDELDELLDAADGGIARVTQHRNSTEPSSSFERRSAGDSSSPRHTATRGTSGPGRRSTAASPWWRTSTTAWRSSTTEGPGSWAGRWSPTASPSN